MAKKGRKNKYDTHVKPFLETIENWCRDGLLEEEICKRLGVGVSTFNDYKSKFSELRETLKNGRPKLKRNQQEVDLETLKGGILICMTKS